MNEHWDDWGEFGVPATRAGERRANERQVISVSDLTRRIKDALAVGVGAVSVVGEVSDLSRPSSGHIYFALKDQRSQIRAVLWRTAARPGFDLADGQEVICQGELDVYGPRGSYQLIVRRVEAVGLGDWQRRLKELHRRLEAEGLFEESRNRPLPRFIRRVALVTSPTGAAVHDFLEVTRRRWRGLQVLVVPVRVQGEGAAEEIARALGEVQRLRPAPQAIVVARGGGSPEDLWCFNEERLVRAVRASRIPVVSAIGHEVDVTLCDLAADVRALTPSEAAERVAPSAAELQELLQQLARRMATGLRGGAERARARLERLVSRPVLQRPEQLVTERWRRVDELQERAARAALRRVVDSRRGVASFAARLESLSPLAVLGRGYSATLRDDGQPLTHAADANIGERLTTRLLSGAVISRVEQVEPGD